MWDGFPLYVPEFSREKDKETTPTSELHSYYSAVILLSSCPGQKCLFIPNLSVAIGKIYVFLCM